MHRCASWARDGEMMVVAWGGAFIQQLIENGTIGMMHCATALQRTSVQCPIHQNATEPDITIKATSIGNTCAQSFPIELQFCLNHLTVDNLQAWAGLYKRHITYKGY